MFKLTMAYLAKSRSWVHQEQISIEQLVAHHRSSESLQNPIPLSELNLEYYQQLSQALKEKGVRIVRKKT